MAAHRGALDSAAWTVGQGTWSGLPAAVEERRLQVELASGTEVVGFDKFGRLAAGCAVDDQPLVVHESGVAETDAGSFPEIHNVAFDPADGQLYVASELAGG